MTMYGLTRWAAIVAAALALSLSAAEAQPYTLKIGSGTVSDTSQEWMRLFKEGVERRSGGKMKVETYVASALGPNPRLVEGVAIGTIEGGLPNTGFLVSLEPRFLVFDAVGVFDGPEHSLKVLQDQDVRKRIAAYGTDKGTETIAVFWHSPLALITHRPVRGPADFAGLKLRTPGGAPLQTKPVEKLAASPISMPIMEALPALQNKAIDGAITGSTVASTLKYYDVAKYMTHLPKSMIFVAAIVNSQFMKAIGPELANIVREEALRAEAPAVQWGVEDATRAREVWEKNGGENIDMSAQNASQYLDEVTSASTPILAQNPKILADYEAFSATAKKYR
jgi:TRAP-type C4-dicarboxylate transport system substrate-binding protein